MSRLDSFLTYCDDALNPVLVKELRQIVRGKIIWLVLTFCASLLAIFIYQAFNDESIVNTQESGKKVFLFIYGILMFVTVFVVPLYHAIRFFNDKNAKADELAYITTISPFEIIKGRFYACMVSVVMIYSLAAPFMCLLFYLPGFSIFNCLLLLSGGICYSALTMSILIILVCYTGNWLASKIGVGISVVVQGIVYGFANAFISTFYYRDYFSSESNILSFLVYIAFMLAFSYLLLRIASNRISNSDDNNMFAIRKYFTLVWFISLIFVTKYNVTDVVLTWELLFAAYAMIIVVNGFDEQDTYSPKVIRKLPKNNDEKFLLFPFYTGFVNAIFWGVIVVTITIFVGNRLLVPTASHGVKGVTSLFIYVFSLILFYGFVGKFLRTYVFKNVSNTLGISIICMFCYSVLHGIFFALFGLRGDDNFFGLFNPWYVGFYLDFSYGQIRTLCFIICMAALLNINVILKQLKQYKDG